MIEAGGKRLESRWVGPGPSEAPTLVFLHEGLGSVSLWRDFPDRLAAATGCGALVYSRAGYGASDPMELPRPVGYMHHEAISVLPEVLARAEIVNAILVGHSDGGSIALIHAAAYPESPVRALVLEAPHVFVEEISVRSIAEAAEAFRTTDLPGRLARHHGDNLEVAFWGWNRVWLDPEFRRWNVEESLPRVRVPALVIQGREDPYGTLAQVESIRRRSGGPVETLVLDECGHSPHRDHPEAVLEAMAGFVRRVVGPPRALTRRP